MVAVWSGDHVFFQLDFFAGQLFSGNGGFQLAKLQSHRVSICFSDFCLLNLQLPGIWCLVSECHMLLNHLVSRKTFFCIWHGGRKVCTCLVTALALGVFRTIWQESSYGHYTFHNCRSTLLIHSFVNHINHHHLLFIFYIVRDLKMKLYGTHCEPV